VRVNFPLPLTPSRQGEGELLNALNPPYGELAGLWRSFVSLADVALAPDKAVLVSFLSSDDLQLLDNTHVVSRSS